MRGAATHFLDKNQENDGMGWDGMSLLGAFDHSMGHFCVSVFETSMEQIASHYEEDPRHQPLAAEDRLPYQLTLASKWF